MPLEWLQIGNFRCLAEVQLEPAAGMNVIRGKNASGKTSLLEAIFFLGRGRSFRTARREELIRDGCKAFTIVGRTGREGVGVTLGIQGEKGHTEARVGGEKAGSLAMLAEVLAVQVIDPEVHKLIEEGPGRRRRFLDWGVFHVEQGFLPAWQRYRRALRQRNAALKAGAGRQALAPWEEQLIEAADDIEVRRTRYLEKLNRELATTGARLVGENVRVSYDRGWFGDRSFKEALAGAWERDREYQTTHVGPHRADLVIEVRDRRARDRVSRGQQKLTAAALVLSQMTLQAASRTDRGILLMDDPGAELDSDSVKRLLEMVAELPAQVFIAALPQQDLPALSPAAVFHVEQGKIATVV